MLSDDQELFKVGYVHVYLRRFGSQEKARQVERSTLGDCSASCVSGHAGSYFGRTRGGVQEGRVGAHNTSTKESCRRLTVSSVLLLTQNACDHLWPLKSNGKLVDVLRTDLHSYRWDKYVLQQIMISWSLS